MASKVSEDCKIPYFHLHAGTTKAHTPQLKKEGGEAIFLSSKCGQSLLLHHKLSMMDPVHGWTVLLSRQLWMAVHHRLSHPNKEI